MDTKELEKFCPWARIRLIDEVRQRCYAYGLDDAGREEFDRDAAIVKGAVLSALERSQRSELYRRIEQTGYERFCEEMAYTWFNRFAAIRYMEVRGYLPCGVRMLSSYCETSEYDSFSPDCLRVPAELDLPGLECDRVFDLVAAADDEALFRLILVAQMNELAECLPTIFGRVGTADALLLPARLLDRGEEGVLCALVERVKRSMWENVESLGWMYQFYNSEVKDAFFKSKAKETPDTIGPATQLFTPNWIVRYMVQNSLGRLWMLNNPGSHLRDEMEYYIEPDVEHEDFIKIESPEDISLCDPACGSGHILVYAFELLAKMYLEREYRIRDIPGLILSKNLHGMEIDPRAAQIAGLALAMRAREMDRRFFSRGVQADIAVLEPVVLEEGDVPQGAELVKKKDLVDALAHLDEVGSLLAPSEGDLAALREAIELTGADGLFDGSSKNKLKRALNTCEILARRHGCVVANPPYMGSSSFGPFMSKWVKKNYPDVKSDLCTCFIERGFNLAKDRGYSAMVTMASWMFLSSFEAMRRRVLDSKSIVSMCYMGHMVMRIAFNTSATVFANCRTNSLGSYCRIEAKDLDAAGTPVSFPAGETEFYRRDAETFKQIPGTPIAYWLSEKYGHMFELGTMKSAYVSGGRLKTHDNEKYVRNWWEVLASLIGRLWMPLSNGGGFSRWSGMKYDVVNWSDEANDFYDQHGGLPKSGSIERKGICWGLITSGRCSFRVKDQGELFTSGAPTVFMSNQDSERALSIDLAFLNSSIASELLDAINPTLNTTVGDVLSLPMPPSSALDTEVVDYADQSVSIADADWDSFETSWDFKRHPLV